MINYGHDIDTPLSFPHCAKSHLIACQHESLDRDNGDESTGARVVNSVSFSVEALPTLTVGTCETVGTYLCGMATVLTWGGEANLASLTTFCSDMGG